MLHYIYFAICITVESHSDFMCIKQLQSYETSVNVGPFVYC
jgi:hypothetical protein